jgi:hypothetical protein
MITHLLFNLETLNNNFENEALKLQLRIFRPIASVHFDNIQMLIFHNFKQNYDEWGIDF